MARASRSSTISRKIGRFRTERRLILAAILAVVAYAAYVWIEAHPEHNPAAPLDLRHPIGMATATKLVALRADIQECRAVLARSEVASSVLTAS